MPLVPLIFFLYIINFNIYWKKNLYIDHQYFKKMLYLMWKKIYNNNSKKKYVGTLWLLVRLILIYSTQNVANCATICKGESVRWTSTLLDMRESCMQRTQSLLCPFSGKIFLLTMSCCIYTQRHVTHALQIKASWSTILKTNDKCCRYMWIINGFFLHLLTLFLIFMKAKLLARKNI